jgi:hypothetical protein
MVSTAGLTRSKGRVSQAGKTSTPSSPQNTRRSLARRSASVLVGIATTIGWRLDSSARPATKMARAASGTVSVVVVAPSTSARTGSSRSSGGNDRRLTRRL